MMLDQQLKVLIVDDEPGLRLSLKAYLEDEGYHVTSATSGEKALQYMANECFDAVIVDVRLPCMTGDETIRMMLQKGYKTHFLIHTGSSEYKVPNDLLSLGISDNDVFFKPLRNLDILCQALTIRIKNNEVIDK